MLLKKKHFSVPTDFCSFLVRISEGREHLMHKIWDLPSRNLKSRRNTKANDQSVTNYLMHNVKCLKICRVSLGAKEDRVVLRRPQTEKQMAY